MSSVTQETISGAKWGLLQKFTMQPIQLVYGMVLARLITPEEMGIVGLTAIFFAIAGQLAQAGFGSALIRKIDRTEEDCSTMFWFNVGMSFLVSLVLFLLAPWFTRFYNQPELLWLTRASAINMFISSTSSVHWVLYSARRDFKTPAIINSVTTLAGMPVCLGLAWLGWGVWALMWQGIFTTLLSLSIVWVVSPWKPRFLFSKASFLSLFGFGSKLAYSGILHILYTHARTFIIGKFYSSSQLGLYNRGEQIAALGPQTITSILSSVTYPILSSIQNDDERLKKVYRKYIRVSSFIIAFITAVAISLAEPAIRLLYGDNWVPCAVFLQIVAIAFGTEHVSSINLNLLMVKGRSDLFLRLEIIKKTISIAMLLYAATISVEAICWATAIYSQIAIYINTYYSKKILNLSWLRQQTDYFPYYIRAAIACYPAWLCTHTDWVSVVQLLVGGSIATSLYLIPLYLQKDESFVEILQAIKQHKWR